MEDDLKKTKNGRQPQKNKKQWKTTSKKTKQKRPKRTKLPHFYLNGF